MLLSSKRVLIKICERCTCVTQLSCVKPVTNVKNAVQNLPVGGQTSKLLVNLAGSGCRSDSSSNRERGLHPPLSDLAKSHKVSHSHKLLLSSPKEPLPAGSITSAYRQKRSRAGTKSKISGIFNRLFLVLKPIVEAYTRSEQTKSFPPGGKFQNGDTRDHQDIPPRGVCHLNRFQRHLLPYTNTGTVQAISEISCPGPDMSFLPHSP